MNPYVEKLAKQADSTGKPVRWRTIIHEDGRRIKKRDVPPTAHAACKTYGGYLRGLMESVNPEDYGCFKDIVRDMRKSVVEDDVATWRSVLRGDQDDLCDPMSYEDAVRMGDELRESLPDDLIDIDLGPDI